jgi:hypothetical protein
MYTDCIIANYITMDFINSNHVDPYNRDTIFCDTLDHVYEYARVMLSLDSFDNVNLTEAQATYQVVFAGLLLALMAYQISCRQGLATALSTQNFL